MRRRVLPCDHPKRRAISVIVLRSTLWRRARSARSTPGACCGGGSAFSCLRWRDLLRAGKVAARDVRDVHAVAFEHAQHEVQLVGHDRHFAGGLPAEVFQLLMAFGVTAGEPAKALTVFGGGS